MAFEYDPRKAQTNRQKHGISFADAELVFFDPLAIHDIDPDSINEDRFVASNSHYENSRLKSLLLKAFKI